MQQLGTIPYTFLHRSGLGNLQRPMPRKDTIAAEYIIGANRSVCAKARARGDHTWSVLPLWRWRCFSVAHRAQEM